MDHIETKILNSYTIQEAAQNMVFAARLTQQGHSIEKKEPIPLCLVDFKTLDIYSLQDHYRSIFIRDYYVEMDFKDTSVETKAFYMPERL